MNYRHAYHAGNFADVFKHGILVLLLEHLKRKPGPFFVLDTHAGTGDYDLRSAEAEKTGEHRSGIDRLDAAPTIPEPLGPYVRLVRAANGPGPLRRYPGSPWIIRALLRPCDRLIACELHPADAETLAAQFAGDRQVAASRMDGYQALKALLPPRERRGLVLIDPPYEDRDETNRILGAIALGLRRWATGIFAVWYPIKERAAVWRFHDRLAELGLPRTLVAELTVAEEDDPFRLNGCGMVIVNPPWRLDEILASTLPALRGILSPGVGASRVEWLVPETDAAR